MTQIFIRPNPRGPHANCCPGEISHGEHLIHIYADENNLLSALERFVMDGLEAGDGIVMAPTRAHRIALEERLLRRGINLRASEQYISCDAEDALKELLVGNWVEDAMFERFVGGMMARARGKENRRVRIFGEIVSVMWAQGLSEATSRLEHLWHGLLRKEKFALFCAYPKEGFHHETDATAKEIFTLHSRFLVE